jgi:hypothetical protein
MTTPLTADISLDGATQATDEIVASHVAAGGVLAVTAYDSAAWQNIPHNTGAVLPYADGRFAFSHKAFPHARYRYFSVTGEWQHASMFDIEPGCIWPPSAARSLVQQRDAHFHDAVVYCFRSAVGAVQQAMHGLNYKAIVSTLDGTILKNYQGWELSGCQFWGGATAPYDKTIIFDRNFLHAP